MPFQWTELTHGADCLMCLSNLFNHDDVFPRGEKLQQKYIVIRMWPNPLQKIQFTCICVTNYLINRMHKITNAFWCK